jgi:hypothetical protein
MSQSIAGTPLPPYLYIRCEVFIDYAIAKTCRIESDGCSWVGKNRVDAELVDSVKGKCAVGGLVDSFIAVMWQPDHEIGSDGKACVLRGTQVIDVVKLCQFAEYPKVLWVQRFEAHRHVHASSPPKRCAVTWSEVFQPSEDAETKIQFPQTLQELMEMWMAGEVVVVEAKAPIPCSKTP